MQPKPKLYALGLLFVRQRGRGGIETNLQAGSCIATSPEQAITFGHDIARSRWPRYAEGWTISVSWSEIDIDARIRKVVGDA